MEEIKQALKTDIPNPDGNKQKKTHGITAEWQLDQPGKEKREPDVEQVNHDPQNDEPDILPFMIQETTLDGGCRGIHKQNLSHK